MFSSPAYATMLSDRDVLLLGQKAKAFTVYLPVPFCLIICLISTRTLLLMYLTPSLRVSVSYLSSLPERRGASNDQDKWWYMPYIRSLHSRTLPLEGLQLPQCGTSIFPLVRVEPKRHNKLWAAMLRCSALGGKRGLVQWECNVLPRMSDLWSLHSLLFAGWCWSAFTNTCDRFLISNCR